MSDCVNDAMNLAGLWLILFGVVVFFYQALVLRSPWADIWRSLIGHRNRDVENPHATVFRVIFIAGLFLAVAYGLAQCEAGALVSVGS